MPSAPSDTCAALKMSGLRSGEHSNTSPDAVTRVKSSTCVDRSTQVEDFTLVTASGEMLECSPERNPDIFKAAQVSLGTLGIIAKVTLRVVPAKRLHYQGYRKKLSDCQANLEQYKQENSHFEFFWLPYTDGVQAKFMNETIDPPSKSNLWADFNKIVLENGVYWLLSESCRLFPSFCKTVCRI